MPTRRHDVKETARDLEVVVDLDGDSDADLDVSAFTPARFAPLFTPGAPSQEGELTVVSWLRRDPAPS